MNYQKADRSTAASSAETSTSANGGWFSNVFAASQMGEAETEEQSSLLSSFSQGVEELDTEVPEGLAINGRDPSSSVSVYSTTGELLGRFPADQGGYAFFMHPVVFWAFQAYHGVDCHEVFHDDVTLDVATLINLSTCYLTPDGFQKIVDIAKDSVDPEEGFIERFYILAYGSDGEIQVIDRSEQIDANWASPQRHEDMVTVEAGWDTLKEYGTEQPEMTVLAAGHTHPKEDGMERANGPSVMRPGSTSDYTPFVGKLGQLSGLEGTPAFIGTEHGVSIYQTATGQLTEYGHDAIGDQAGDRYGTHDVYDNKGVHIYKELPHEEAPWMTGHLTDRQKSDRKRLRRDMEAHKKGGGRQ